MDNVRKFKLKYFGYLKSIFYVSNQGDILWKYYGWKINNIYKIGNVAEL